jgi:hypothetical protein
LRRLELAGTVAVVEAQRFLVARQRIDQIDHHFPGNGEIADLLAFLQQIAGQRREAGLAHLRFGGERGDEAAGKLDVAADIAFKPGPDQADLVQHPGTLRLVEQAPVLVLGDDPRHRDDQQGDEGRDVRGPEDKSRRLPAPSDREPHRRLVCVPLAAKTGPLHGVLKLGFRNVRSTQQDRQGLRLRLCRHRRPAPVRS